MAKKIDRDEVQKLVGEGAQVVDVMPPAEYEELHLPGAIHLFLKTLNARTAAVLDKKRLVIVYCYDNQ
ncbi:MAG TPA: rhodanese-like domain-containing protein [Anaerolineales bacterium]|nr:rhodanese-like domain-containing protein [Anaerolineales bacterium]